MNTYFLPTERCRFDQAKRNADIQGLEIIKGEGLQYRCEGFGVQAYICIEKGWVRGGWQHEVDDSDTVQLVLTLITNCEWVGEYDEKFFAYLNWNQRERVASANEAAQDVIEMAKLEGYTLTEQEAVKDEIHYELSERKRFGVGEALPLAVPVHEFDLYAPSKPCRIDDALENARIAGLYVDYHKSGKIDFSYGPLTDEQGSVTNKPVVTALIEDGFIKDAAVYTWSTNNSNETLHAITRCTWY